MYRFWQFCLLFSVLMEFFFCFYLFGFYLFIRFLFIYSTVLRFLMGPNAPLLKQRLVITKGTYSNIFNSIQTKIFILGKYSFVSVSIIAWLAYDINEGGENTTQNLCSCQKVILRRNIIIETANKIINKQGKSVMLDFFTNCSDLCQLTVATSRRTMYIS